VVGAESSGLLAFVFQTATEIDRDHSGGLTTDSLTWTRADDRMQT
jgi:hypothetical protein